MSSGPTIDFSKYEQAPTSIDFSKYAEPSAPPAKAEPALPANSAKPNPSMPTSRYMDYAHDIEEHPQTSELAGQVGVLGAGALGAAGLGEVPVVGPALRWAGDKLGPLKPFVYSEAIKQARRIPVVGRLIPSYSEFLPFLGLGKGAKPEPEPTYPGAPEPTATPEQLNPALTSPARTLPGQVGREVYPGVESPAPIPPRSGLMLESPREAILRRLSDQAGQIQQEEAAAVPADEAQAPAPVVRPGRTLKVNGRTVDPNQDLTSAGERSVIEARKRRGLPVQ